MSSKNTTSILKALRGYMKNTKYVNSALNAYIVPSEDAHQSEYIAEWDCRRPFVSGFTGSSGTAIVTEDKAALWTDGRYDIQAEQQLDSNWILMKESSKDTPSQGEWLSKVLPAGGGTVGVDPFLMAQERWKPLSKLLKSNGHCLIPVSQNLIDLVWTDRPKICYNPLLILSKEYCGKSWREKIDEVREKLKEKDASALIVTALDEIAWLFNLRGTDVMYNPVFFAYAVVEMKEIHLFTPLTIDSKLKKHLTDNIMKVSIHPYEKLSDFLEQLPEKAEGKIWVSEKSSHAVFNSIPKKKRFVQASPISFLKAIKNKTEIEGMKRAHVKDAVTLCEFFNWLEQEVPKGEVTECSAAEKLEFIKRDQKDYKGLSFETISSVGSNGAIIHYKPSPETDTKLSMEEIYLCDSGAQYLDGTTDVTRTMHFGTPSQHEKECFTRMLKGHIKLSSAVFPTGLKGGLIDCLARLSLWDAGLDYCHGTGHGVGSYLNVHEGPCSIGQRIPSDATIQEDMFFSDEPGYYEDGKFGCRIENVVLVVKSERKFNFKDKGFLTFEPVTLVPIQAKLIDPTLLTEKEISWLNDYHTKCRDIVGEELKRQNKEAALNWLMKETQQIG